MEEAKQINKLYHLINMADMVAREVDWLWSGKMQAYCDIEAEMVNDMFGNIVQGYLKKGYNLATAKMMVGSFSSMRASKIKCKK